MQDPSLNQEDQSLRESKRKWRTSLGATKSRKLPPSWEQVMSQAIPTDEDIEGHPTRGVALGEENSHFPNRDPAEINAEGINVRSSLHSCLPLPTSAFHWQDSTGSQSAKEPGRCRTASQGTEKGREGGGGNAKVNGECTQESALESNKARRKRGRSRARRAWGNILNFNRVVRRKWYFRKILK